MMTFVGHHCWPPFGHSCASVRVTARQCASSFHLTFYSRLHVGHHCWPPFGHFWSSLVVIIPPHVLLTFHVGHHCWPPFGHFWSSLVVIIPPHVLLTFACWSSLLATVWPLVRVSARKCASVRVIISPHVLLTFACWSSLLATFWPLLVIQFLNVLQICMLQEIGFMMTLLCSPIS